MTVQAHVNGDGLMDSVKVWIVNHLDGDRRLLLRINGDEYFSQSWVELSGQGEVVDPTFELHDASARALLDALTRHFHGAEDTRALRRDYDDERRRVDGLIKIVGDSLK